MKRDTTDFMDERGRKKVIRWEWKDSWERQNGKRTRGLPEGERRKERPRKVTEGGSKRLIPFDFRPPTSDFLCPLPFSPFARSPRKKVKKYFANLFKFKFLINLVAIIILGGYSSLAFVPSVTTKRLPPVKKVLLKYHLEKFLSSELDFTPLLSAENHPHGWQDPDCLKCHQTPSWQPSTVCVNCHGQNGVNGQKDTCSSCHKTLNEFGYPSNGNHESHVFKGPRDKDCLQCHPGSNSITHANGFVDVFFIKGGEYRAAYNFGPFEMTIQPIGACSGIACHEDRQWGGKGCKKCHGNPPNTGSHIVHFEKHTEATCRDCHKDNKPKAYSPLCKGGRGIGVGEPCEHDDDKNSGFIDIGGVEYDNITGYCRTKCHDTVKSDKPLIWNCTSCHGYPPKRGNPKAYSPLFKGGGGIGVGEASEHNPNIHRMGCEQCHKDHRHSYKAATRPWDFSDTTVAFAHGGEYKVAPDDKMAGGTCSGLIGCHESRIWGSKCIDCHGNPPNTSTHVSHLKQHDITCQSCHENNVHKSRSFREGYKTEGLIEIGGIEYDATTGNCASACHNPRLLPFTSMKWDCINCHGYPPASGAHISHDTPSGKIMDWPPVKNTKSLLSRFYQSTFDAKQPGVPCVQCHADHQHSYKAAVVPMDFTSVQVRFSQGGNFNPKDGLCGNIICHEPRKWNSKCGDCHANPPYTGLHTMHLQRPNVNCDSCHRERKHDLDDKSGTIDIGGIIYDKFTGRCVSVCHEHEKEDLWGCLSCHGNPPYTGQHLIHITKFKLGCHTCHADHEHSYKSATAPNEYDGATVKFSIRGNWDESTKACTNIGCHGDKKWDTAQK